jgi:hypothetical protein
MQSLTTFLNGYAINTGPVAYSNNQLFGFDSTLNVVQVWDLSSENATGYITGFPLSAVRHMGIWYTQSKTMLVCVTLDSTLLVFDASYISSYPDAQQMNYYSIVGTTRPVFGNDGSAYTVNFNGAYLLSLEWHSSVLVAMVRNTESSGCYGMTVTSSNIYLGCSSGSLYIYRIISTQITYQSIIFTTTRFADLQANPAGTRLYGALGNGNINYWYISASDGSLQFAGGTMYLIKHPTTKVTY